MEFPKKFYTLQEAAQICLITKRIVSLDIKRKKVEAHLRKRKYVCCGAIFRMKTFVIRKEHLANYFAYRMALLKRKEDMKQFLQSKKKVSA